MTKRLARIYKILMPGDLKATTNSSMGSQVLFTILTNAETLEFGMGRSARIRIQPCKAESCT